MRLPALLLALVGLLVAVWPARADTIIGFGFFYGFPQQLFSAGTPFWDNPSEDQPDQGIGRFLTGTGSFTEPTPGMPMPWFGRDNALPETDVYFGAGNKTLTAELFLELTSGAHTHEFGWYDITNPSVLHPVFVGSDTVRRTVQFTPSPFFGFYYLVFVRGNVPELFRSQASQNGVAPNEQKFAIFYDRSSALWLGMEDQIGNVGPEGRGDFNDLVVKISTFDLDVELPEPSTSALMGVGLAGIALLLARRRSA